MEVKNQIGNFLCDRYDNLKLADISVRTRTSIHNMSTRWHSAVRKLLKNTNRSCKRKISHSSHSTQYLRNRVIECGGFRLIRSCYLTVQVETNADMCIKPLHNGLYPTDKHKKRQFLHFVGLYLLKFLKHCSGSSYCIRIPISKQHQISW